MLEIDMNYYFVILLTYLCSQKTEHFSELLWPGWEDEPVAGNLLSSWGHQGHVGVVHALGKSFDDVLLESVERLKHFQVHLQERQMEIKCVFRINFWKQIAPWKRKLNQKPGIMSSNRNKRSDRYVYWSSVYYCRIKQQNNYHPRNY